MLDLGRHSVLGVRVAAVDYETAVQRIMDAARAGRPLGVSALAVHGVMTGALDPIHRVRLNALDLVVPDGQPVRWALRWLHGVSLPDRVRGPTLVSKVCERAASDGVPVYFYGSTPETLQRLIGKLTARHPTLRVAGSSPSAFRPLSEDEQAAAAKRIRESGARIVFIGLGCPRQEIWAYENVTLVGMPALAVGAAFNFHAGTLSEAPEWMQRIGLEWLYRLLTEPARLGRRYLLLNPLYLLMVVAQLIGLLRFERRGIPDRMPPAIRAG